MAEPVCAASTAGTASARRASAGTKKTFVCAVRLNPWATSHSAAHRTSQIQTHCMCAQRAILQS